MKDARLYSPLIVFALLAACASRTPQQQADAALTDTTSAAAADNGWQALRAKYMDCVQRRAADGILGTAQAKSVVSAALSACEGDLSAMHDAFRDHLSTQMSSSGARRASDRVTQDTREKARVYLTGYVEHERYVANSR